MLFLEHKKTLETQESILMLFLEHKKTPVANLQQQAFFIYSLII